MNAGWFFASHAHRMSAFGGGAENICSDRFVRLLTAISDIGRVPLLSCHFMPPNNDTNWNGRFEERGDAGLNAFKRIWSQSSTVLGCRGRMDIRHCFLSNACVV